MARQRWQAGPLIVLLAVAGMLLTLWAFSVPLGEGTDEPDHIAYAHYLWQHHNLPPYGRSYVEANEPPLYYALIAPLAAKVFPTVPDAYRESGGHLRLAHPPSEWKHPPNEVAQYPLLYAARLLSVALSLVTITCTYLAGLELAGRRSEALLAGGAVALLPQFCSRGTNITADTLVITLCAAATLVTVRIACRGFTWRRALAGSVLVGLAGLSKVTGLAVLPALMLVILMGPNLTRTSLIRRLAPLIVVPVLMAPYLLRNQMLYGDPLAARAMGSAVPELIVHHSLFSSYFAGPFPTLLVQSFVARFGWMNLPVPLPILIVLVTPALVGIAALPRAFRLSEQRRVLAILLTIPTVAMMAVIGINLSFTQPQGRYLFPALPAMAVAAAVLYRHVPHWPQRQRLLVPCVLGFYALLNLTILLSVVRPAYGV